MNICKIWDAEYPWDVRTEKVSRALTDSGHSVHLVARNRDHRSTVENLTEATVHRIAPLPLIGERLNAISMFPAFFNPRWIRKIYRTARSIEAELLICRDLPLAPTAVVVGRRLRIPVVLDMAENYPAMLRAIWDSDRQRAIDVFVRNPALARRVERWVLRRVDHILVVVEESRERLINSGVQPERVTVVSNTPPLDRVKRRPAAPHESDSATLRLVYLGLLETPRGIGILIDGVARLRKAGVPVQLSIIGTGRDREHFENRVERLGLSDGTVRFEGYLPNPAALDLLRSASVGVVPHFANESWNTTIPNKLFDYMAAGLAVLTSDAKPIARIVRETACGEIFADRDISAFVRAAKRLTDPRRRARYARAGQNAILEKYNWEQDAGRMLNGLKIVRSECQSEEDDRYVA